MNKAIIALEEYDKLKRIKEAYEKQQINIHAWVNHVDYSYTIKLSTKNEQISKQILDTVKGHFRDFEGLHKEINELVELKYKHNKNISSLKDEIKRVYKRGLFSRIFNKRVYRQEFLLSSGE